MQPCPLDLWVVVNELPALVRVARRVAAPPLFWRRRSARVRHFDAYFVARR